MRCSLTVGSHGTFTYDQDLYDQAVAYPMDDLRIIVRSIYAGTGIPMGNLRKFQLAAIVADSLTGARDNSR